MTLGVVAVVFGARSTPTRDWVVAREGLVCFEVDFTVFLPWQQVTAMEGTTVLFWGAPEVTLHGGGTLPPVPTASWTLEGIDDATLSAIRACVQEPSTRGRHPTFRHPEGPPEAVLAGIEPVVEQADSTGPEVKMGFREDLATLCAKLDGRQHAEELKKLQRCRRVEDLEHLAAQDGGWLTRGTRDPRLKLVRHGTGTFLVVQYDDGWSTTISQAPFRKRR